MATPMADEKPLHAQVAEALGWTNLRCSLADGSAQWGVNPSGRYRIMWDNLRLDLVPRFDSDWRATGPLMERYARSVYGLGGGGWEAMAREAGHLGRGETPLVAVCRLVLHLHADGKLAKP